MRDVGRMAVIALGALILCSCRGPGGPVCSSPPPADQAGVACAGASDAAPNGRPNQPVVQQVTYVEARPGVDRGGPASIAENGGPACPSDQAVPMPYTPRGPWAPPGIRQPWPADEYLRDGGDEGVPAMVSGRHELGGVEPEDTVAVYQTPDGETKVQPSNEVFLYAPRFGAVRQVVSLVSDEERNRVNSVDSPIAVRSPTTSETAVGTKQNIQLADQSAARPPVAMRTRQGDGLMSSAIGPRGFQDGFRPYENLSIIRLGAFEEAEMAFLARGAKAAIAWEHTDAVQVFLGARNAMAAVKFDEAMSVYTVSQPPGKPKLQLVKVASTAFAQPGDMVDFTIRFDNLGNEPLANVVIVDSLSPRLEYVSAPKSTQCSVEARFSTEPNRAGSLVVRCALSRPLQPGQGGILRFQCRVR